MIDEALERYPFGRPDAELIRHNENMTYKITDGGQSYVLRIHKPSDGFNVELLYPCMDRTGLIADEMELLLCLMGRENIRTQKVKFNSLGEPVTILGDKTPVTVLEWIEGETLENIGVTAEIAYKIGAMTGELHNAAGHGVFKRRYRYDGSLLSRMIDEAAKALTQGHFSNQHAKIIIDTLSHIRDYLSGAAERFIIVHADLGKSNLIYHNDTVVPIDFSLSGYCVPEMDLAAVFNHIDDELLIREVLNGYASVRGFEPERAGIENCYCLQILLFIIIQHNRFAAEPWFQERLNDWGGKYFIPLIEKAI